MYVFHSKPQTLSETDFVTFRLEVLFHSVHKLHRRHPCNRQIPAKKKRIFVLLSRNKIHFLLLLFYFFTTCDKKIPLKA